MANALEQLDVLIDEMRLALTREDWETLLELTLAVTHRVEPVMEELSRGELSPEVVAERLQELQLFVETGQQKAGFARDTLRKTLSDVSRNRNAAKTYQNVSGRGSHR